MILRYVSSQSVITRLRRKFQNTDWFGFSIIYMADAIIELGFAAQRKNTVAKGSLTVANYKALLPCDMDQLEKVEKVDTNSSNTQQPRCRLYYNQDASMRALSCDDYTWRKENTGDWYSIEPPYILTSFASGTIDIFYKGLVTDEKGFIMIPDIPAYKLYLEWYVTTQLISEGYKPKNPNMNWDKADFETERYRQRAKARLHEMSEDEHIRFTHIMNSFSVADVERIYMDAQ